MSEEELLELARMLRKYAARPTCLSIFRYFASEVADFIEREKN